MATRLSHKEKGFVKDILKGETGVQSAFNNYETEDYSTAGNIASENLKKPKIINAIQEALPDELLATVHTEGLSANFKGEPDYSVRHKYLDSAYKLKGSYAAEKSIHLNIDLEPSKKILDLASQLLVLQYKHEEGSENDTGAEGQSKQES